MNSVLSTALGLSSVDLGRIIGGIADWVTIGAFVITLVGLLSAFLARGKLRISVYGEPNSSSFSLTLSNTGSNPVQQIAYHRAWITRAGKPLAGDGTVPLVQALYPGDSFYVHIFDSEVHTWSGEVRSNEARWGSSRRSDGAVVVLTWRNFLVPWMRRRRVLILMFGNPVIQIGGRRARAVVRDVTSMGPGSTPGAIRAELAKANGGVLPAEQTLQDRYPREIAELRPEEFSSRPWPERVQLYLGVDLLADGHPEGYVFQGPADTPHMVDVAATRGAGRFLMIDGQNFELGESHRIRIFARDY